tara:strand:- start:3681 stop:3926 length:246 start_codon:yes stop_codon:yes gene_type:complete
MSEKITNVALVAESTHDFKLKDSYYACWITVKNISVYIQQTDEGVAVDLWPRGLEDKDSSISGAWLTYKEAQEYLDEQEAA